MQTLVVDLDRLHMVARRAAMFAVCWRLGDGLLNPRIAFCPLHSIREDFRSAGFLAGCRGCCAARNSRIVNTVTSIGALIVGVVKVDLGTNTGRSAFSGDQRASSTWLIGRRRSAAASSSRLVVLELAGAQQPLTSSIESYE